MSADRLLLLLLLHSTVTIYTQNDITSFRMEGFANDNLTLTNSSVILPNRLLLLAGNDSNQMGHAFFPNPLNLKNSTSFSTTFVFTMIYPNNVGDHGMAFALSPFVTLPYADANENLGLFVGNASRNESNKHIFAVELDTVWNRNVEDIQDNHVGIDVEGLKSINASAASYIDENGKNNSLDLHSGERMQVWIEYNSSNNMIEVRLAPLHTPRPEISLVSAVVDLSSILADKTYAGFSASTGGAYGYHYVLGWSFSMDGEPLEELELESLPELPTQRRTRSLSTTVIFGLVIIVGLVVVGVCISGIMYWRWRKRKFEELVEEGELSYGPNRIAYKELYKATKGFKEENLLGAGGFGRVYMGTMPKTSVQVAVKRISHHSSQGVREFVVEITSMARLRHRNLVQLLGYCRRKGELLLVYDYMENGSLDKFLYSSMGEKLSWEQRFKVAKDVAEGLNYLHEGWEQVVIHRDIKASNVLLDSDFNGHLGDFGLSKILDRADVEQQTTRVVGTLGYMAPEMTRVGKATTFTDVYAFGSFLLEVVCGKHPMITTGGNEDGVDKTPHLLVDWVLELWRRNAILAAVDSRVADDYSEVEAETLLKLGVLCSQEQPAMRPTMRQVLQALEGDLLVPVNPPGQRSSEMALATVVTVSEGAAPSTSAWSSEQLENERSSLNLDAISFFDPEDCDLYPLTLISSQKGN